MTLEEYLDQLTEHNWHTLRALIELERGTLTPDLEEETEHAYTAAIETLNAERITRAGRQMAEALDN